MSNLMKVTTIFLAIYLMVLTKEISAETPVRKCSNEAPLPLSVQVDNCSTMPCDLWKGSESQFTVQFVANRNEIMNLKTVVKFTTLGVEIPFVLEASKSDVCTNLLYGAYCPLYKDEDVTYHLVLPIENHHPEVPTKVEISLIDQQDDNNMVSCFVVDAKFKSR
ncbi:NPC intracellular cholesterol transporter 2-like [Haematobia irritans]|uniref:NPC intracellular cholesterol transporter 2-like n=1 Tax=Haematobia irritans TaxID=7368 RepID=UPI003F5060BE